MSSRESSFWRAVLLGGAIGDALGAPVEFLSFTQIRDRFGPAGITEFVEFDGRFGAITDDTQMTLFTAEALLNAHADSRGTNRKISYENSLHRSYLRWLATQDEQSELAPGSRPLKLNGLLWESPELHHRRGPGRTSLAALRTGTFGTASKPINNSKGCGGVMRAAPGARFGGFGLGVTIAAITHGHPTGYLAAGAFVEMLSQLSKGATLADSVDIALSRLAREQHGDETAKALTRARNLAESAASTVDKSAGSQEAEIIEQLGRGWTAEEALAIAVYAALRANGDYRRGVQLAVNHSGDSDSTGAIAGNLLGAMLGEDALPPQWIEQLEARDVIVHMANDLAAAEI